MLFVLFCLGGNIDGIRVIWHDETVVRNGAKSLLTAVIGYAVSKSCHELSPKQMSSFVTNETLGTRSGVNPAVTQH